MVFAIATTSPIHHRTPPVARHITTLSAYATQARPIIIHKVSCTGGGRGGD